MLSFGNVLRLAALAVLASMTLPASAMVIPYTYGGIDGSAVPLPVQMAMANVANLYAQTFADPVAIRIDVEFEGIGSDLGRSSVNVDGLSYASYLAALTADAKTSVDNTALANLPAIAPVGNGNVRITPANERAIGLPSSAFLLGSDGVTRFDGKVTFSNSANFFYRDGGTIGASQYDFYATAEHETNEVLGTYSNVGGLPGNNSIFPSDLFRYRDNTGTRSFARNAAIPAYLSIDGSTLIVPYNQTGSGDYGDWTGTCFVQNDTACAGKLADNGAPEITLLDAIGYDGAVPEPATWTLLGGSLAFLLLLRRSRSRIA